MDCHHCSGKAVIELQHGAVCRNHFLDYFENKVFKTIRKYHLLEPEERICVAASGGKDSLTVLYLIKKYLEQNKSLLGNGARSRNGESAGAGLFALAIDEGIHDYRSKTLEDLREFCAQHSVPLQVVRSEQEFGATLDEAYPKINRDTQKKPCHVCGVWRRYLINKYARKLGASKVVTGHNLDDEAQAMVMNLFKGNTSLASHLGPVSGVQEHELFVQRVKPLYFCTEKETRLYALLQKFQVEFAECPYARGGFRAKIQEMLNDFEQQYPGTKQGIINSFLDVLPLLKAREKDREKRSENGESQLKKDIKKGGLKGGDMERHGIKACQKCGEPSHGEICNACRMKEVLTRQKEVLIPPGLIPHEP